MNNIVSAGAHYNSIHSNTVTLLATARHAAARNVNALIIATYWEMGHRIVEFEQAGQEWVAYGQALIQRLTGNLAAWFGRGFSRQNLLNKTQRELETKRFTSVVAQTGITK